MGTVRMGEIEVSSQTGEELVARGLGSCIGLAMIDRASGVAGMAHIVLPEAPGAPEPDAEPGKFADRAVPELISQMKRAGATVRRLDAVVVGGAQMFEIGVMDIGARNTAAVQAGLARSGVIVRATDTGGNRGRTMRVTVGEFTVRVKEAGGETTTLFEGGNRRTGTSTSTKGKAAR